MQPFSLRCHPPGTAAPSSTFFILSRGNNAGRPSYTPNPNCFAFTCAACDLDRYYWIVFALWETGHFRTYLMGSVIPFIRIRSVRLVIEDGHAKQELIEKLLSTLQQLRETEAALKRQIVKIRQYRSALFWKINEAGAAHAADTAPMAG